MKLDDLILKYALQNAVKFDGKANAGAVIGKVFSDDPNLKKDATQVSKKVQEIIKQVNKLSVEEQRKRLEKLAPELLEKKKIEERKDLPELNDAVMGKVVTRIPPEPSKYNHVGHAMSFLINYMYAKKYKGKCILKFEDTNPEKCTKEFADAMEEDILNYLKIKADKIVYISDDMEKMYEHAEKLIDMGKAYVCFCSRDKMQELRHKGVGCEHRDGSPKKNMDEWKNMISKKYKTGEAVLRLKGYMKSNNHVMRDPVMFRVSYAEHFRHGNKYCVWPLYDFENAVEDCRYGVTHILRSSEFGEMRNELQNYIKDLFGYKKQTIVHYGRINIIGAVAQGRVIREMISKKEVIGWDDPRLVTLRALKRRGIDYRTFYEVVYKVGLSLAETNIDWSVIATTNRKIIDKEVNRYFFVKEPKLVKIDGAPKQEVSLDLHPDFPERGKRVFKTSDEFYIANDDYKVLKEKRLYRLMDCLNFVNKGNKLVFDSLEYEKYKDKGEKIMHWLPKQSDLIKVEVMMPDANYVKGFGEPLMKELKVDEVIQAERFGFLRLDKKEKEKLVFWFTHK